MTFGEEIRLRRLNKDLTVTELSKMTGISSPTLYCYERDYRYPTVYYAKIIANALDCTIDDLMLGVRCN